MAYLGSRLENLTDKNGKFTFKTQVQRRDMNGLRHLNFIMGGEGGPLCIPLVLLPFPFFFSGVDHSLNVGGGRGRKTT